MVFTHQAQYFLLIILGLLGMVIYVLSKVFFPFDDHGLYWPIFILWFLLIWRLSPPYKNFQFKTENLPIDPTGEKPLFFSTGLGSIWQVWCSGFDQEKGACFSIARLTRMLSNNFQKEEVKNFYLLPSPSNAWLMHLSGHLKILVVNPDGVTMERYIEKVKSNSFGIILHFVGQSGDHGFAMIETIKRKLSWRNFLTIFRSGRR